MTITRLGEGLEAGGAIRAAAAERTAAAVQGFVALAESSGAPLPTVVGTYALRIACNPEELLTRLSVPVRVLEGQEEARLGFYGVLSGLESVPPATRLLVVDIGGGSVEVSYGTPRGMTGSLSLPLGAVTLTQHFLRHDPPRAAEIAALHSHLSRILDPHLSRLRGRRFRLIGVGGTITTMAALAQHLDPYDPDKVHGFRLRTPAADAITADLLARRLADRRLRGLQPERADIIPAGALAVQHILRTLGQRSMTVSEADLLWGVVLEV